MYFTDNEGPIFKSAERQGKKVILFMFQFLDNREEDKM